MGDIKPKTIIDDKRRKRIQNYKKAIKLIILTVILLPTVLCIFLFARLGSMERELDELKGLIADVKDTGDTDEQEKSTEEKSTEGNSDAVDEETTEAKEQTTKENTVNTSKPSNIKPYKSWSEEERAIINKYKGQGIGKKIYLTFDDGPSVYTKEILDILDYYGIKATFFVVGKEDSVSSEGYKAIVDRGHTIGLHSYSHRYSEIYSSIDGFARDLKKIQDYVYELTGQKTFYYRFPGGTSTTKTILSIDTFISYLNNNGFVYYDWNATCGDGANETVPVNNIVINVLKDAVKRENCIALLHDAKSKRTTVDGLPLLIETLISAGFEICPIDDDTVPAQHRIVN